MGLFFYNIFLVLFKTGVRITAPFNTKAKNWVAGRRAIWEKLRSEVGGRDSQEAGGGRQWSGAAPSNTIWMHCASLGEFEQGRPLLEKLKSQYPHSKMLLTFFSPSGYEIRKDYKGADWVFYLPMDGARNAKRFLQIVKPSLVIFVKYEFWYYYLKEVKQNNVPLLLVSALFRENSIFFKWYGGFQRQMLSFFDHLFVQNGSSKSLLDSIGISNNSVSGDTRFDRVIEIAEKFSPIAVIEKFAGNHKSIVAGSTWPRDEAVLQKTMEVINDPDLKLIIAPHEIDKDHIAQLQKIFPASVCYSQFSASDSGNPRTGLQSANILIIDNIGMLSKLYKYATITYIGGGFGKGIHNTLEAAVYGKPVIFGPAYHKFQEAVDLIKTGGAITINNADDCIAAVQKLRQDTSAYQKTCESSRNYVYVNKGATEAIMKFIQEKRLLTR